MNKIIDYDHDTLIELINNALPQIEKQYTLLIEIDKLVKKYNELFRKREEQKSNFVSMLVATLVLLAIIIACIVTISKQFPSDLFNPILISFALFCIFIVSLIPIIYFSSRHSTQKKLNKYKEKLESQYKEINDYREKNNALRIIPFVYQTPIAMQEIIIYLINFRAVNWTEAVNILEDTIHKNQMIYLQSKQLSTLNQQLDTLNGIQKNTQTSDLDVLKFLVSVAG